MTRTRIVLLLTTLCVTAACSDSSGPDLHGSPFFRGTVDGAAWTPGSVFAFCGDDALMISAVVAPLIPNTDLVELHIGEVTSTGSYSLGDSASGRYAHTLNLRATGPTYRTSTQVPGTVKITGIDFTDSLVAGTFQFRLISEESVADIHEVGGSFRLPLSAIFTAEHPDGGTCHAAFVMLEAGTGGPRQVLTWSHGGIEDDLQMRVPVDVLDLDHDGVPELITRTSY